MTRHLTRPRRLLAALAITTLTGGLVAAAPTSATADPAPARVSVDPSARAAPAPYRVGLNANRATVLAKGSLLLRGTVVPRGKGTRVVLQKRLPGRGWTVEARTTTVANGAYRFVDKPSTAGVRSYRVVVPATTRRSAGTSKPVTVTVVRWLALKDVAVRTQSSTYARSSTMINAVRYEPVFLGSGYANAGSVDWNFQRRCTSLRARFGVSDDSDDGARAAIDVVADGKSLFAQSFGLTESTYRTLDVRNVFRLAFTWTSSNPAGTPTDQSGAVAALAAPEVLCSF